MIMQPSSSRVNSGALLLLVAFLLVNAPNCHLSLERTSVVQGDAVNCNTSREGGLSCCYTEGCQFDSHFGWHRAMQHCGSKVIYYAKLDTATIPVAVSTSFDTC